MFIKKLFIIINVFFFFCSPTDSEDKSVSISEIMVDKSEITVSDTVKFECVANSSATLHHHWDISNIVEKANASAAFDHGKWIKWVPPAAGSWTIEVIAYLSSADHSTAGSGSNWETYIEYNQFGIIQHCFDNAEQGELWDKKEITIVVSN